LHVPLLDDRASLQASPLKPCPSALDDFVKWELDNRTGATLVYWDQGNGWGCRGCLGLAYATEQMGVTRRKVAKMYRLADRVGMGLANGKLVGVKGQHAATGSDCCGSTNPWSVGCWASGPWPCERTLHRVGLLRPRQCNNWATMLTLGVDLAWQTPRGKVPNKTGVVALDDSGTVIDAGWVTGIERAAQWIDGHRGSAPVCFVDAPLVVSNTDHQRWCEKEVGRHYWSVKVSANSTNLAQGRARLGGVRLLDSLRELGWTYDDGLAGPPGTGLRVSECYPYTALVGALEFAPRPAYKRRPKAVPTPEWRTYRAGEFRRIVTALVDVAPALAPLDLTSHGLTATLLGEPPTDNRDYKDQEDLLDAVLCAWTAQVWLWHGSARCQVLHGQPSAEGSVASIIAPYEAGGGQACSCGPERT